MAHSRTSALLLACLAFTASTAEIRAKRQIGGGILGDTSTVGVTVPGGIAGATLPGVSGLPVNPVQLELVAREIVQAIESLSSVLNGPSGLPAAIQPTLTAAIRPLENTLNVVNSLLASLGAPTVSVPTVPGVSGLPTVSASGPTLGSSLPPVGPVIPTLGPILI